MASRCLDACIVAVVDPELMQSRINQLDLDVKVEIFNNNHTQAHIPGVIRVLPVKLKSSVTPGMMEPAIPRRNTDGESSTFTRPKRPSNC